MNTFVHNDNMLYNDDSFKRTKTILRCCLDIVVDVDLEAYLHVLNVTKCTSKSGTGTQSYKGG